MKLPKFREASTETWLGDTSMASTRDKVNGSPNGNTSGSLRSIKIF